MRKIHLAAALAAFFCLFIAENALFAQADRWQQKVNYKMDVKVDAENNRFSGKPGHYLLYFRKTRFGIF